MEEVRPHEISINGFDRITLVREILIEGCTRTLSSSAKDMIKSLQIIMEAFTVISDECHPVRAYEKLHPSKVNLLLGDIMLQVREIPIIMLSFKGNRSSFDFMAELLIEWDIMDVQALVPMAQEFLDRVVRPVER